MAIICAEQALPRMRVARECFAMIREVDPDSRVSERYIRALAKSGRIPTAKVGNRLLINYDSLLTYLQNPISEVQTKSGIRPINER